ncbi:MAG: hypothetical protein ABIS21_05110, partial [Acidimicrobiales bacterium]
MSGEQQLERSVLEAKEREELQAIAEALGLKPASRASKATLVGQILRATGVDESPNGTSEAPPRRARPARGRAAVGANASAGDASSPSPATDSAPGSADASLETWPPGSEDAPPAEPESQLMVDSSVEQEADGESPAGAPVADDPPTENGANPPSGVTSPASDEAERPGAAPPYRTNPQRDNHGGGGAPAPQRPWDAANASGQPESANRRRRRRGRERDQRTDRPEQRSERDLQGGGQDQQFQGDPIPVAGLLDLNDQGYGFLRARGYLPSPDDAYVSISQVRRFALRKGDQIEGTCRPAGTTEKYPALLRIDTVSGLTPDEARARPRFEDLTPLFPDQKL